MSSGSSITGDAASAFQLNRRSNGLSAASGSKRRRSGRFASYGARSAIGEKASIGREATASNWLRGGRLSARNSSLMIDPKLATALRIVFRDNHQHLRPPAAVRQRLHDAAEREVVVRHVGLAKRVAVGGMRLRQVILRQDHRHELWKRLAAALPPLAQLLLEHVDPVLIRNRHVERWIETRRAIEERLRQWEADAHPDAGLLERLLLERCRHLGSEPEVVERDAVAREVLPERAGLVVVLGQNGRGGVRDVAAAGSRAEQPGLD